MLKECSDDSGYKDIKEWIDIHRKLSPHFEFWYGLLELEYLMLIFVCILRSGNS